MHDKPYLVIIITTQYSLAYSLLLHLFHFPGVAMLETNRRKRGAKLPEAAMLDTNRRKRGTKLYRIQ